MQDVTGVIGQFAQKLFFEEALSCGKTASGTRISVNGILFYLFNAP